MGRCTHKTKIVAKLKHGNMIELEITSLYKNIQRLGEKFREISIKDSAKPIIANPAYITASDAVGPKCLVPPALIKTGRAEAGMITKESTEAVPPPSPEV